MYSCVVIQPLDVTQQSRREFLKIAIKKKKKKTVPLTLLMRFKACLNSVGGIPIILEVIGMSYNIAYVKWIKWGILLRLVSQNLHLTIQTLYNCNILVLQTSCYTRASFFTEYLCRAPMIQLRSLQISQKIVRQTRERRQREKERESKKPSSFKMSAKFILLY